MSAGPRNHQEESICLSIRPLRDGESEVIAQVFDQLSRESAFLRFHSGMPCLPPTFLRRLSAVIPGTCEAYVAELDGLPVGVARWHRYPNEPGTADLAVEVADSVHRRGIATLLLRAVIEGSRSSARRCTRRTEWCVGGCVRSEPSRRWRTTATIGSRPSVPSCWRAIPSSRHSQCGSRLGVSRAPKGPVGSCAGPIRGCMRNAVARPGTAAGGGRGSGRRPRRSATARCSCGLGYATPSPRSRRGVA